MSVWCFSFISPKLDYDMATQRMCVQRGPSDSEDRCAHTVYNYKKVYMCFCQGDLCNAATNTFAPNLFKLSLIAIGIAFRNLATRWWYKPTWKCIDFYFIVSNRNCIYKDVHHEQLGSPFYINWLHMRKRNKASWKFWIF